MGKFQFRLFGGNGIFSIDLHHGNGISHYYDPLLDALQIVVLPSECQQQKEIRHGPHRDLALTHPDGFDQHQIIRIEWSRCGSGNCINSADSPA
ncbi:MAG: hypothetical protein WCI38_10695 [Chthoniobacterales bacterium]